MLYISIGRVARAIKMTRQATANWLKANDALITIGSGKKRYTTRALLKERFSDIFAELERLL